MRPHRCDIGKTAWIVALVEIAVLQGLTVLLCGHTHASVDNVLLRLKQRRNISFLRLGRHDLVHHGIWDHCLYSPNRPSKKNLVFHVLHDISSCDFRTQNSKRMEANLRKS